MQIKPKRPYMFQLLDKVYVREDAPQEEIGALWRVFVTIVSEVREIDGEYLTLQIHGYTLRVHSKYCEHYR